MQVLPFDAALGAEVHGLDLAHGIDDGVFARIFEAWLAYGVLLFRDQKLDESALVAFSRGFGELELRPASASFGRDDPGGAIRPEVWIISNVVEDGEPIGSLGAGEAEWHTDMSYLEAPPSASLLWAREVPPTGGNTCYASMYAALEALPARLRRCIEGLRAKHDSSYTSAGELRKGAEPVTDASAAPGAIHPIVRTHPVSGRKALYLGRRTNGYVEGLALDESERLLDELWSLAARPELVWEHDWRAGDLLIWDNRCVLHRRDAFDSRSRRVMLRTQVKGDRPF